jgi:hypothetical protein
VWWDGYFLDGRPRPFPKLNPEPPGGPGLESGVGDSSAAAIDPPPTPIAGKMFVSENAPAEDGSVVCPKRPIDVASSVSTKLSCHSFQSTAT